MAGAFTEDEIVAVANWLRSQAMRDDLDTDMREGLNNSQDAVTSMLYDLKTCRAGLLDLREFNRTTDRWIDGLLGDGPVPS